MDYDSWSIDLNTATAVHATGFKVIVEGNPNNPTSIVPGQPPEGLSAVEQARLLRCGLQAIIDASQRKPKIEIRKRLKKHTAARHPNRPVLSLKR